MSTIIYAVPPQGVSAAVISDNMEWNRAPAGPWQLYAAVNQFYKKVVSKFDSAFCKNKVKVFLKINGSSEWKVIPYVTQNMGVPNSYDFYFMAYDNSGILPFPFAGFVPSLRILIFAKPNAPIDFHKKVSVKVIVYQ